MQYQVGSFTVDTEAVPPVTIEAPFPVGERVRSLGFLEAVGQELAELRAQVAAVEDLARQLGQRIYPVPLGIYPSPFKELHAEVSRLFEDYTAACEPSPIETAFATLVRAAQAVPLPDVEHVDSAEDLARREGYDANLAAHPTETNPFAPGSAGHKAWRLGWWMAQNAEDRP